MRNTELADQKRACSASSKSDKTTTVAGHPIIWFSVTIVGGVEVTTKAPLRTKNAVRASPFCRNPGSPVASASSLVSIWEWTSGPDPNERPRRATCLPTRWRRTNDPTGMYGAPRLRRELSFRGSVAQPPYLSARFARLMSSAHELRSSFVRSAALCSRVQRR